jgi:hypothetical protein
LSEGFIELLQNCLYRDSYLAQKGRYDSFPLFKKGIEDMLGFDLLMTSLGGYLLGILNSLLGLEGKFVKSHT